MKSKFFKLLAGIFLLFASIIVALIVYNVVQTSKYKNPVISQQLSESEQAHAGFVFDLKDQYGKQIWPGFDTSNIPMILFNDQYEFILGLEGGKLPDTTHYIKDEKWYRRNAVNPQAFAVRIGETWAGSLGAQKQMNREMYNGIRHEMPSFVSKIFPFFLIDVSEEMHISGMVHEMFHAYQATCNEEKFLEADRSHQYLKNYPYDHENFASLWNKEGDYLKKALYAEDKESTAIYADSFLIIRSERRKTEGIIPEHIRTEKQLEWLEGSAKYVESVSYEMARETDPEQYAFKTRNPYWELERNQRLGSLGEGGGDNRFYHSGAAMAFLLDRLEPGWKNSAMKDSIYLEDLLVSATR